MEAPTAHQTTNLILLKVMSKFIFSFLTKRSLAQ
jgi:hypothetical protein